MEHENNFIETNDYIKSIINKMSLLISRKEGHEFSYNN